MYTQDEQNSGEQLALAIGQALGSARENSGLSVQDVAERTRISAAHLSALEAGQFERLPGVGYIPGFIRNYCQAVGIDATPHVDSFKSLSSAATKKPEYSFPVQALVPRVAGSMIAMFAVLVGLAVYVGWTFISYNQTDEPELIASSISPVDQPDLGLDTAPVIPDSPAQPDEQTVSETAPAADVEPVEPVAPAAPRTDEAVSVADLAPQPDTATAVTPPQQTLTTPQADQLADVQAPATDTDTDTDTSLPVTAPAADPDQTQIAAVPDAPAVIAPQTASDEGGDEPVAGVGAQATQRLPAEEVIIRATASSWIEVTRADGEVLLTQLMRSGDQLVFSSDENLFLSTGNAGGLRLEMPNIAAFDAGQTGEILRDLRLNRESIQNRQLLATY